MRLTPNRFSADAKEGSTPVLLSFLLNTHYSLLTTLYSLLTTKKIALRDDFFAYMQYFYYLCTAKVFENR